MWGFGGIILKKCFELFNAISEFQRIVRKKKQASWIEFLWWILLWWITLFYIRIGWRGICISPLDPPMVVLHYTYYRHNCTMPRTWWRFSNSINTLIGMKCIHTERTVFQIHHFDTSVYASSSSSRGSANHVRASVSRWDGHQANRGKKWPHYYIAYACSRCHSIPLYLIICLFYLFKTSRFME